MHMTASDQSNICGQDPGQVCSIIPSSWLNNPVQYLPLGSHDRADENRSCPAGHNKATVD